MSTLLIEDQPLLVSKKLAVHIGLNEALFLQQLHYWIKKSAFTAEGSTWIYNTYDAWQEQFPFWSISTIRRIVAGLKKRGLIKLANYNKKRSDQTKWYAIQYEVLQELENDSYSDIMDESFCTPEESNLNNAPIQDENATCSTWTEEQVKMANSLPKSTSKSSSESTSKILKSEEEKERARVPQKNPFQFFEENGFGTIGSYISEKITAWCTDLTDDLVVMAMELAVEHGCKSWKYVEAILRDFVDKGHETRKDVEAAHLAFKEKKKKPLSTTYQDELVKKLQNGYDPCEMPPKEEIDVEKVRSELEKELQKYKK